MPFFRRARQVPGDMSNAAGEIRERVKGIPFIDNWFCRSAHHFALPFRNFPLSMTCLYASPSVMSRITAIVSRLLYSLPSSSQGQFLRRLPLPSSA